MRSKKKRKKGSIASIEIDFLFGMHIKNGRYSLQPHITQELLKFLDENFIK